MGASKQKQFRSENPQAPKESFAQQAAAERKKTNTRLTIGVVVILVVAILAGVINSPIFDTSLTAVKTGETKWSLAEVRYAKQTAYSQFSTNYSGLVSYLIDSSKPLDEQQCSFDPEITWDEYFLEEGLKYLQEMAAYSDLAEAEGYTLSEEQTKTIDDSLLMYEQYAKLYGYTTDGYLTAMFGEGNSVKTVKAMMEMTTLAAAYAQDKQDSFTDSYSVADLDAWYKENANDYNTVTFLTTTIQAEKAEDGTVTDEAMKTARATAESIGALCDGTSEGFAAAVKEVMGTDATEGSSVISGMGEASAWAAGGKHSPGDMTIAEGEGVYTLYCFLSLDDNSGKTANVRHILVSVVDADEDGVISEEEKTAAENTINSIKDQWDGTEEGFAELANKHSEDPGSNSNGGLYEGIYQGQMVSEFDEFCFGDRKVGDTDIVYNDAYGYFFIYYVGEGEIYQRVLASNAKTSEDFTAWKNGLLEDYPIEKASLFKKA